MSYSISVGNLAKIQMIASADWYLEQKPGLEIRFIKNINAAIELVRKNPLKCQLRYKNVRICFLRDFDHGIHYIVEDKRIFVIAIYHTSQDTEHWK